MYSTCLPLVNPGENSCEQFVESCSGQVVLGRLDLHNSSLDVGRNGNAAPRDLSHLPERGTGSRVWRNYDESFQQYQNYLNLQSRLRAFAADLYGRWCDEVRNSLNLPSGYAIPREDQERLWERRWRAEIRGLRRLNRLHGNYWQSCS